MMRTSGRSPEIAAGTSLVIATLFLLRVVIQQHDRVIGLLELQRQMRGLACTGRSLGWPISVNSTFVSTEEIAAAGAGNHFFIALLDLNGFSNRSMMRMGMPSVTCCCAKLPSGCAGRAAGMPSSRGRVATN
nr:hypothetical protein [Sphingopyxis sp.]